MFDSDHTFTSPLTGTPYAGAPVLTLTVLWHPDLARIGEQYLQVDAEQALEVSRFFPPFAHPGRDGLGLGHGSVSRQPLRLARETGGRLALTPPDSRMTVEVNGSEIAQAVMLERAQLDHGIVLGLGRSILLCVHWTDRLPRDNPVAGLLGVSAAAIQVRELIRTVAPTELPVLLLGETGTGKEVAARAIHALGQRADRPLVAVNMAVMNEGLAAAELFGTARGAYTGAQSARSGLFAEADGATLFLDEIGNTPAAVQPMLLRVLESGQYRVVGGDTERRSSARVIAATDQDLSGQDFSQALLRRLERFVITLPPLRARREDIGVLIVHALAQARSAGGAALPALPFAFVSACANYDWPGNVRQLSHVLARALLLAQAGQLPLFEALVGVRHAAWPASLPVSTAAAPGPAAVPARRRALDEFNDEEVVAALHNNGWQVQGAAAELGISRPSMYKLIEAHPAIRRPEAIGQEELQQAMAQGGADIERCAALLLVPAEALRRHLRGLGLLG
ncbi:sigma 54-interacting transcriptional regulator [Massilia phyllosphaerae]|uniref:sigma 54-interacting transcriptional regulator n=1 Tax=Massilia phyllosphaerae TaxID=3106034 RepID=UPI002B1CADAD|nr:sigma 54-interacting transcriptional regulator [Massilia sp. SGZ-792]